MASRFCPDCKFPNAPTARVCLLCKSALDGPPPPPASAPARGPEPSPKVLAWLCCDPFAPRALTRGGGVLTLGRSDDCDVVLPHHSISRCHAELLLEDEGLRLRNRSQNGSFLNGKRVGPEGAALHVGDVVTIGPYDLELTAEPRRNDGSAAEQTSELDFASMMSGLLEETPIVEVLQGLEFNRKSGTLTILSGRLRGLLVVREGRPWFANLGDQRDDEAVLAMLSLGEGRFVFSPSPEAGPQRMRTSVTGLLLEASRRADEGTKRL